MITPSRIQVENEERISDGYLKVPRYLIRHEQYAGSWTQALSREVMERGEVAAVLPFDPARNEVVLIEQFRVGAWSADWAQPWLVECVAGVVEAGETPEEMVKREAREEADCDITALEPIARYFSTPGACSERVHLFCGRVDATGLGACRDWPKKEKISALPSGLWQTLSRCSRPARSATA